LKSLFDEADGEMSYIHADPAINIYKFSTGVVNGDRMAACSSFAVISKYSMEKNDGAKKVSAVFCGGVGWFCLAGE
jgi:hypothetical protein